jgi:tetratricopeptide (TPR) repeat protein
VVSQRLVAALCLSALLAGCATPSGLPPVIASEGMDEPQANPQQELPVPPSQSATRTLPDTGSATLALLKQSDRAVSSGDTDEAVAYVERAIRLNPRQADLWLRLAELQLVRKDPAAAVQFANKAITLAGRHMEWVRDAWLVIADARAAQGDAAQAEEIRQRWQTYRG